LQAVVEKTKTDKDNELLQLSEDLNKKTAYNEKLHKRFKTLESSLEEEKVLNGQMREKLTYLEANTDAKNQVRKRRLNPKLYDNDLSLFF
jgi:hypothetical protein